MSNSHDTTSPPRRWTEASIRKSPPFPKPSGAIDKVDHVPELHPSPTAGDFIRRILAGADLLDVVTVNEIGRHEVRWLLVPVGAALDVVSEDLEDGADREHDTADDEATDIAASNDVDQENAWRPLSLAASQHDDGDDEPDGAAECGWVPDWAPWTFPSSESVKAAPTNKMLPVAAVAD